MLSTETFVEMQKRHLGIVTLLAIIPELAWLNELPSGVFIGSIMAVLSAIEIHPWHLRVWAHVMLFLLDCLSPSGKHQPSTTAAWPAWAGVKRANSSQMAALEVMA